MITLHWYTNKAAEFLNAGSLRLDIVELSKEQIQPLSLPITGSILASQDKVAALTYQRRVSINVEPDDSSYRYRALMQKPQLVLKFSLPEYIDIPVGAWCEFQNQVFTLNSEKNLTKNGKRNITYNMTLGGDEDRLSLYKMRNSVDGRLKYSMCAKPRELVEEVVKNLNKREGKDVWSVGACVESTEKTVEFNHVYIDAALQSIADTFETEWEIANHVISLHKVEYFKDSPMQLSYGRGNGFVPGLGRTTSTDEAPVKRIYTQGGTRNIDRSKYGGANSDFPEYDTSSAELRLPPNQTLEYEGRTYRTDKQGYYVERTDKVSTAVKEDSLDCSEIYPSRVGKVSSVVNVNIGKHFYDVVDTTIPSTLNYNDYIIDGESPTIIFQSGMLSGKEFEFKYKHDKRRFEIVPQEIDGITMPDPVSGYMPKEGDEYAVFGIMLPKQYFYNNEDKTGAAWDMFREAAKKLYECEDQKFTFTGELQGLWAKRNWLRVGGRLVVGGYILFSDEQFAKDGLPIRITGIKDYLNDPYAPKLEISNSVTGKTVRSEIAKIENTEVVIEDTKQGLMQYTKRRFNNAKETIKMLEDAQLDTFTNSISPVAVQTMSLLVGDESLQFRFVKRLEFSDGNGTQHVSYSPVRPIVYDNDKKQLSANMESMGMKVCLQHLTLGQRAIMTKERRDKNGYYTWEMQSFTSPVLDDPSRKYYFYAKVHRTNTDEAGEFVLSEKAIEMEQVANYYHLLCGVLNSEIDGERSYVSMYGFTEVLPGRVTTDLIISNDGKTYFDLERGEIGGAIKFLSDNGYITLIEGGKIKTELLDVSQIIARSVIVGEPDKQRVEIKPDSSGNGSVKIFDAGDNECTVFEGESYNDIKELYDGSTGAGCEILSRTGTDAGYDSGVTLGRGKLSVAQTEEYPKDKQDEYKTFEISKVWHTGTPTEVYINTGSISAEAYAAGYTMTTGGNSMVSYAEAILRISVETYKDYDEETGTLSNKIVSTEIAYTSAYANATAKPPTYIDGNPYALDIDDEDDSIPNKPRIGNGSSYTYAPDSQTTGNIDIKGKRVRVPAGYHRIVIQCNLNCSRKGSHATITWGNTTGKLSDITAKWISDFYVSRYFANGFCLGTRSDNYILAYKRADGMRLVMENNDIGFDFSKSGLRTRVKGKNWMPLPMLIYKAAYKFDSSNSTYAIDSTQGTRSFNGENMPAKRQNQGLVTLSFPDSWKTELEGIVVNNLLVQVNALHQVIDCRVEQITTSAIKVAMSDDYTRNDGNFSIVIYYLSS